MGRAHETSGKKEIAKKKKEKLREKAERREQRQSNTSKGKGLEDLMAYVDENRNLTTAPPPAVPTRARRIRRWLQRWLIELPRYARSTPTTKRQFPSIW